jgi:N-acetylglucosamine kinase-like BadF-type ATPase
MKQFALAIDIGGTKTDVIIADERGHSVSKFKHQGINLHNHSQAQVNITLSQIIQKTTSQVNSPAQLRISSACIGLTSFDTPQNQLTWKKIILSILKEHNITIENLLLIPDAYLALKSGTSKIPAITLIVGTGTNCYGIDSKLAECKSGDWGYLVGDQGSGYWLGKQIIELAIKELDGRLQPTLISDQVLSVTKSADLSCLIDHIYHQDHVVRVAQLSKLLKNLELQRLPQIQDIIRSGIIELTISLQAVINRLDTRSRIPLVCVGGMFQLPVFKTEFIKEITNSFVRLDLIFPNFPPVVTAMDLALSSQPEKNLPASAQLLSVTV